MSFHNLILDKLLLDLALATVPTGETIEVVEGKASERVSALVGVRPGGSGPVFEADAEAYTNRTGAGVASFQVECFLASANTDRDLMDFVDNLRNKLELPESNTASLTVAGKGTVQDVTVIEADMDDQGEDRTQTNIPRATLEVAVRYDYERGAL